LSRRFSGRVILVLTYGSKVGATNKEEAERVGKCIIRSILSLNKLSFEGTEGKVSYQYGKDRAGEEQVDYLELIARAGPATIFDPFYSPLVEINCLI
jgi:hypothetical protein